MQAREHNLLIAYSDISLTQWGTANDYMNENVKDRLLHLSFICFVLHLGLIYERVMSMLYYNLIRVLTNPPLSNTKIEIVYQIPCWHMKKKHGDRIKLMG